MQRRLILTVGLALLAATLVFLGLTWFTNRESTLPAVGDDQVAEKLAQFHSKPPPAPPAPPQPIDSARPLRLAVGSLGLPDDAQNRQLADLVTAELSGAPGLELVERLALDAILREAAHSFSGLVRAQDAVQLGKLLRADWFLLGAGTGSAGTNRLVARVVDARSGLMYDVALFDQTTPTRLAGELAGFVRRCREAASQPQPRVYLAIGGFADVGVNARQADFPSALRASLLKSYQGSGVTLLERQVLSELLQEVQLDLAGLTAETSANAPQMLSAFWLVDGYYQSFEDVGAEVEVELRIHKIFGRTSTALFRGAPTEALFARMKGAVDDAMLQAGTTNRAPTRRSEITAQMEMGYELMQLVMGASFPITGGGFYMPPPMGVEQSGSRQRRNLEEALRAFDSALLLEPGNADVMFHRGLCLEHWAIGRTDEARDAYRQVASIPIKSEAWSTRACAALGWSYQMLDAEEAAKWFREAARLGNEPAYANLAEQLLEHGQLAQARKSGVLTPQARAVAIEHLRHMLRTAQMLASGGASQNGDVVDRLCGLTSFADCFGTNRQAAARELAQMLPELQTQHPALAPRLLAAVVCCQTDTNAPVVAEFLKSLSQYRNHPAAVSNAVGFFSVVGREVYSWCLKQRAYGLALEMIEVKAEAGQTIPALMLNRQDQVRMATAYAKLEQWSDALRCLEQLGDEPVEMDDSGPWGKVLDGFQPAKAAAQCRTKLGLPPAPASGSFELSAPLLHLLPQSALAAGDGGIWIATEGRLLLVDKHLQTNLTVTFPEAAYAPVTCICASPTHVWVGTDGSGLIEYDKNRKICRRRGEADGLLLDEVASLALQGETLWIGFGHDDLAGGLGRLDLRSGRLSALTATLARNPVNTPSADAPNGPPRHHVWGVAAGIPGEIWVGVGEVGVRRYRVAENMWDGLPAPAGGGWARCLADNSERLVAGARLAPKSMGSTQYGGTLWTCARADSRWNMPLGQSGLPGSPTALAMQGQDLWVGGEGFVASVNLADGKVRRLCRLNTKRVDSLTIAEGQLWVHYNHHLHRVALNDAR